MNGGYTMINANGLDIAEDSSQTIEGLYNELVSAMTQNKPIQFYNANNDGADLTPIGAFAYASDGTIVCTAATLTITVTSADAVTVVNSAS